MNMIHCSTMLGWMWIPNLLGLRIRI